MKIYRLFLFLFTAKNNIYYLIIDKHATLLKNEYAKQQNVSELIFVSYEGVIVFLSAEKWIITIIKEIIWKLCFYQFGENFRFIQEDKLWQSQKP